MGKKWSFIIIIFLLSIYSNAQQNVELIKFEQGNTFLFEFNISGIKAKAEKFNIEHELTSYNELYFSFLDLQKGKCFIVAPEKLNTKIVSETIQNLGGLASLEKSESLTKEQYLEFYSSLSCWKNSDKMPEGYPKFYNTRNKDKDGNAYLTAREIWESIYNQ